MFYVLVVIERIRTAADIDSTETLERVFYMVLLFVFIMNLRVIIAFVFLNGDRLLL